MPGVSVAVINHGEIEWAKGYGLADIHTKTPVTPETLFQAGSVSKPVAAMAALKLVEEKKLNLDGDVNSQLKSWKVPENKFTKQHAVDLRGILSHTAGFTIHGFAGYVVGKPIPTLIQVLDGERPPANSRPVRVDKVPGKGFRYSGGGVTVMQQLVIDVTGQPFPQVVHNLVLAPLAMTSSTYQQPLPEALTSRALSGHTRQGKTFTGRWHASRTGGRRPLDHPVRRRPLRDRSAAGTRRQVAQGSLAQNGRRDAHAAGGRTGRAGTVPQRNGRSGTLRARRSERGLQLQVRRLRRRRPGAIVMTNSDSGGVAVRRNPERGRRGVRLAQLSAARGARSSSSTTKRWRRSSATTAWDSSAK